MSKSTRNSGKSWSPKDVRELRTLAAGNTPTRVIGLKLGRTPAQQYLPLEAAFQLAQQRMGRYPQHPIAFLGRRRYHFPFAVA